MSTHYEFVIESSDRHGDILETEPFTSLKEALGFLPLVDRYEGGKVEIALCYITGNDLDGETDRQYAYAEDGKWPDTLDGGRRIPAHIMRQLQTIKQGG